MAKGSGSSTDPWGELVRSQKMTSPDVEIFGNVCDCQNVTHMLNHTRTKLTNKMHGILCLQC